MTDVILIHPITSPIKQDLYFLPLGLLSVSSLVYKEGYKIKIIDQRINTEWKKDLLRELKTEPICVGINSMIGTQILAGVAISKIVKENSNASVMWGGPFPTIQPHTTIENKYIDTVCVGQGEITFSECVKTLDKRKSLKNVRGIWYKERGKIKKNRPRPLIDLNQLPDPPYHLLNLKAYEIKSPQPPIFYRKMICVNTSVGCPHSCTYCYNSSCYPEWNALNPVRVIELLQRLNDEYNPDLFYFTDDNFFVSKRRVKKIMEGILKEKMDVRFGFQGIRINSLAELSKKDLNLISRAGAIAFSIGIESGSPRILKMLKKETNPRQIYAVNKRLYQYNDIYLHYNIMAGFPTETIKEFFMTVNMIRKLQKENRRIILPRIFLFTPFPETEIYKLAIDHGFIPPKTLEEWGNIDWSIWGEKGLYDFRPWLSEEFKAIFKKISLMMELIYATKYHKSEIKNLVKIYKPIAKFRLTHNFFSFMPEVNIVDIFLSRLQKKRFANTAE
jgi:radical SAM superfamily enzyme YgiQ (UPF0313 family)